MFVITVRSTPEQLGDIIKAITPLTIDFDVASVDTPKPSSRRIIKKMIKTRDDTGLTFGQRELLKILPINEDITPPLATEKYVSLGYNASGISATLSRLVAEGRLERVREGVYRRIG